MKTNSIRWTLADSAVAAIPLAVFSFAVALFGLAGFLCGGVMAACFIGIFGKRALLTTVMTFFILVTACMGLQFFGWETRHIVASLVVMFLTYIFMKWDKNPF